MTSAALRRLAICQDDYGLHPGVNDAALQLIGQGRLQAVSCMVGAPYWAAGAPALARLPAGQVDVGLHLDLTEHPLGHEPRRALREVMLAALLRRLDRTTLRAEITAQLDTFEQTFGRAPDHVDGHQHVHQLPVVREVLMDVLQRRYPTAGRARPWLRSTKRPANLQAPQAGAFKPWLIETLGSAVLGRLAQARGFVQNRRFLGIYGFDGDEASYRALLAQWLAAAGDGDLLMCHPALDSGADDAIRAARRREQAVLASADFGALLAQAGLALAPLSRTLAGPAGTGTAQAASL